jgi:hypothetical protein
MALSRRRRRPLHRRVFTPRANTKTKTKTWQADAAALICSVLACLSLSLDRYLTCGAVVAGCSGPK